MLNNNLKDQIDKQIEQSPVFLYMKGTPEAPMCGFSAGVIQVLNSLDIDYKSFNVLSDESIRQGIKDYSQWPTIPQLYVEKEFIGGHDIIMQMFRDGSLQERVGKVQR